jgi:hypothetical protein
MDRRRGALSEGHIREKYKKEDQCEKTGPSLSITHRVSQAVAMASDRGTGLNSFVFVVHH